MIERSIHARGDIVLTQVPFTDGGVGKTRPALVLAVQNGGGLDGLVILVPITSSSRRLADPEPTDILVESFHEAGLEKLSLIQASRPFTSQMRYLVKFIGRINDLKLAEVQSALLSFLDIEKPRTPIGSPRRD